MTGVTIPFIDGGTPWRVGTVYCLGKNYRKHAIEMGQTEARPPVVFLKPAAAVVPLEDELWIPADRGAVHHEVELVLALAPPAGGDPSGEGPSRRWAPTRDEADGAIVAITVGIDLTLRDEQNAAKRAGEPWARAKGFPGSAPVLPLRRRRAGESLGAIEVALSVNGSQRQRGRVADMTLDPVSIVVTLAARFPIAEGDIVFTGTPEGVGPIEVGDVVGVEGAGIGAGEATARGRSRRRG